MKDANAPSLFDEDVNPAAHQLWRSDCGCVRKVLVRTQDGERSRAAAAHWFHRSGSGPLRPLDEHVLIFKMRGAASVEMRLDGRRQSKRPLNGSCSVVPNGTDTFWSVEGEHETLHLYIPDQAVQDFAERHPELSGRSIAPAFAAEDRWLGAYLQMFLAQVPSLEAGEPAALFLAESQHLLLRHLLARSGDDAGLGRNGRVSPLRPFLMRRVVQFIEENLAGEITLAQLAEQVHMSPDHFLRAFSAAVGTTPHKYVQEQRLGSAARLLNASELDVQEVARRCGYRTPSHFAQQFKRRFGVTPLLYRTTRPVEAFTPA